MHKECSQFSGGDEKFLLPPDSRIWSLHLLEFQVIEIPDHIEEIGVEAFNQSESIKKVVLPKSLKHIDIYAFAYCGVKELYYPGFEDDFFDKVKLDQTVFEGSDDLVIFFSDSMVKAKFIEF